MPNHTIEYRERIRELLLHAGVSGLKQKELTYRLSHKLNARQVLAILERWRRVGAVQKFLIEGNPWRVTTMWRATTKLAETDESGEVYKY